MSTSVCTLILVTSAIIAAVIFINRKINSGGTEVTHLFISSRLFGYTSSALPPDLDVDDEGRQVAFVLRRPLIKREWHDSTDLDFFDPKTNAFNMTEQETKTAMFAMLGGSPNNDSVSQLIASILTQSMSCQCVVARTEVTPDVGVVETVKSGMTIPPPVDGSLPQMQSQCHHSYDTDLKSELRVSCSGPGASYDAQNGQPIEIPGDGSFVQLPSKTTAKLNLPSSPTADRCKLKETFGKLDCIASSAFQNDDGSSHVKVMNQRTSHHRSCTYEANLPSKHRLTVSCWSMGNAIGRVRVYSTELGVDATAGRDRWRLPVENDKAASATVTVELKQASIPSAGRIQCKLLTEGMQPSSQ